MTSRLRLAWLHALLLTACMPVAVPLQQAPAAPMEGPQLAVEIANGSNRELAIGYDFTAPASSGGGEGGVPACERTLIHFALVEGDYEVTLDGEPVSSGTVPANLPGSAWILVRLTVDADGMHEWLGSAVVAQAPEPFSRPVAGCG
ncbi:MAG: hypothetical protein ACRDFY_03960 [Candidatus Limnocylindria bacterium]